MIKDDNFDKELISKIKEGHITPKPRWRFAAKNYAIWGIGAITLLLGALTVALIIFMLVHNDWGADRPPVGGPLAEMFFVIPVFWLVCMILFIGVIYFDIKHTKKGYRYSPLIILAASIGSSIILGGIFYAFGLSQKIDDILGRRAPYYEHIINPRIRFWDNPEQGRLVGLIASQVETDKYKLLDRAQHEWTISTDGANKMPGAEITVGKPARLAGNKTGDWQFKVKEILPVETGRRFFDRMGQPPMRPDRLNKNGAPRQFPDQDADKNLSPLFTKYPELKASFSDGLLNNKDMIKERIKNDPEFISHLEALNIDPDVIKQLQAE